MSYTKQESSRQWSKAAAEALSYTPWHWMLWRVYLSCSAGWHVFCCNMWRTRFVGCAVQCWARKWNRKHPLLLLLWYPWLGTGLPMGRRNWFWGNDNLYSAIWDFLCSVSVKRGQSLWSVRKGKQFRHKKGRLDTSSSETTQSKSDVLKFYSMSAPFL